jgi:hypothetical protein
VTDRQMELIRLQHEVIREAEIDATIIRSRLAYQVEDLKRSAESQIRMRYGRAYKGRTNSDWSSSR